jgi:hypothetical protein
MFNCTACGRTFTFLPEEEAIIKEGRKILPNGQDGAIRLFLGYYDPKDDSFYCGCCDKG